MMTMTEAFLLNWLSKEDTSSLGECKCEQLGALYAKGLVTLIPCHGHSDFSRVALTEAGWALIESAS